MRSQKEIYAERKILGQQALEKGLCKLCFTRPIYWEKSKTKCERCYSTIKRCSKKWKDEHPDKIKVYVENYSNKNRENLAQKQRNFRKTNEYHSYYKEYREKTAEHQKERNKRWATENRDKYRRKAQVATELRRYRKHNNKQYQDGSHFLTTKEWRQILEIYGNRCLKCGSTEKIQIDHVVPLSKGGEHSYKNVQPLCHVCNNKKQAGIVDYRIAFFSDWT